MSPPDISAPAPLGAALVGRLRDMVLSGQVAPGARINEVQLAAALGTSRTPVRAALGVLAGEGLLRYQPRRGYRVHRPEARELDDAFEIRAVLEGLAARQAAAERLPREARAEAEAALADGDAALALPADGLGRERLAAYRAANVRFHQAVITASGNALLERMLRQTVNRPLTALSHIPSFTADELRRRHDDHHRIFAAIAARDPWRAEMLMREHVSRVRDATARA